MSFRSRGLHEHRMKLKFNSFGKVMEEWPGVLYLPCILVSSVFWWFGFPKRNHLGGLVGLVWFGCPFDLVTLFLWCLVWSLGVERHTDNDGQINSDDHIDTPLGKPVHSPLPNRLLHTRSITPPKVLQKGDPKAKTNECPLKINGLEDVFPIGMNFLFKEHSLVFRGCS